MVARDRRVRDARNARVVPHPGAYLETCRRCQRRAGRSAAVGPRRRTPRRVRLGDTIGDFELARDGLPRSRRPCIEPVPSQPVVFGPRCETTLTLTPATPVVRLTTLVRLTTFVRPGVVTVVEGPGTVTVWLGPLVVTATVVGRVTVTVVVAPPVVVVVPVVVFAVVDHATPPVAESVSKAAVPTPPRTRAAAIVTTRVLLNSALPVSEPITASPRVAAGLASTNISRDLRFRIAQSR